MVSVIRDPACTATQYINDIAANNVDNNTQPAVPVASNNVKGCALDLAETVAVSPSANPSCARHRPRQLLLAPVAKTQTQVVGEFLRTHYSQEITQIFGHQSGQQHFNNRNTNTGRGINRKKKIDVTNPTETTAAANKEPIFLNGLTCSATNRLRRKVERLLKQQYPENAKVFTKALEDYTRKNALPEYLWESGETEFDVVTCLFNESQFE